MLAKLVTKLNEGIRLPGLNLGLKMQFFRGKKDTAPQHQVFLKSLQRLMIDFPDLKKFYDSEVEEDSSSCLAVLDFFYRWISINHPPASEAKLRSDLLELKSQMKGFRAQKMLDREIALSNLRSGVIDRASILKSDADGEIRSQTETEIAEYERHYESAAPLIQNLKTWQSIPGGIRGNSLRWVYEKKREDFRGKSVLHVAPELSFQNWFNSQLGELGMHYMTLDPFGQTVDIKEDLTSLSLKSASFDHVVCHRVLEHVVDDRAALKEIHRILKPGGTLSASVPQSWNKQATNEWIVPDYSHDGHVRQYGRDFEDRLVSAGFQVKIEKSLLKKSVDDHIRDQTYPLRFYWAHKQ